MKKTILFFALFAMSQTVSAQFIATVEMKEPVEGICNNDAVYALFDGFDGQVSAVCETPKEEMEKTLNDQLQFLKDNPKFKSEGMVGVFINCEGECVQWRISNETKSEVLDQEILEVFKNFSEWTVGTLNGKPVDTSQLFSFKIKKGVLTLN